MPSGRDNMNKCWIKNLNNNFEKTHWLWSVTNLWSTLPPDYSFSFFPLVITVMVAATYSYSTMRKSHENALCITGPLCGEATSLAASQHSGPVMQEGLMFICYECKNHSNRLIQLRVTISYLEGWIPFCCWHFEMLFLQNHCTFIILHFIKVCSYGCHKQEVRVGFVYCFTLNKQKAITWNSDDPEWWCIYMYQLVTMGNKVSSMSIFWRRSLMFLQGWSV